METLTRIYIFFIGIIALLVCFITWVSIKLRAERINRIRLEKQGHDDFNKIFNLEYEIKGLKRSIESLDKIIENNRQINQSNESTIKLLEERIQRQANSISKDEQTIENLRKCIERTGIRDIKGVTRKVETGEVQSVISGTHAILNKPEKKGKNKEDMSAKEKAEEFIEKFAPVMPNEDWKEKARQCALIAVDEVLKAFDTEWAKLEFWTEELGDTTKYWQQVKLEIQTL